MQPNFATLVSLVSLVSHIIFVAHHVGGKRKRSSSMAICGIIASILALLVGIELILYTFLIPDISQKPYEAYPLEKLSGRAAYRIAYILSLLRVPWPASLYYQVVHHITKLFIVFILKIPYDSPRSMYSREVMNMFGDFVNLGLTTLLVLILVGPPALRPLNCMLFLPIAAEIIRLVTERVPITFSALWQLLPHRALPQCSHRGLKRGLSGATLLVIVAIISSMIPLAPSMFSVHSSAAPR